MSSDIDNLVNASERFLSWFRESAVPLWVERAWNEENGGFHEALDFDGTPAAVPFRRVRVQARQIHTFANASAAGWSPEGAYLSMQGLDYFLDKCCPDGGTSGCIHRVGPGDVVLDDRRDLYDQAFALLACASLWRTMRDVRALALAETIIEFLDRELAAPSGGYFEDNRGTRPRRQNPHMHLFEAMLALHDATDEENWLVRADHIFALFQNHFFLATEGRLVEFFDDNWQPARGEAGCVVEPGHMVEWVWLLDNYGEKRDTDVRSLQRQIFENARCLGADGDFLVGRVLVGSGEINRSRRLWPQTEYLRACLVRARHGDDEAATAGTRLVDGLFKTYLDQPVVGLWCDAYDAHGRPDAENVPASIFYHLHTAALETERFLGYRR